MATLYTHQDTNIRKTWLLVTVFLIIIIGVGWGFSYIYNAPEILIIAIVFAVVMNVIAYFKSDKIALRISGARPITKQDYRELYNITENLAITAGIPMPRLYVIDEPAPNAFATGRDSKHAAIAVTTGLISILDRTELEGVIAHELSHIGNRDILLSTIVVILVGFIALLSDMFLRMTFFGGMRGGRDKGRAGLILMLVGIALAILAPIIAMLIQLAISRKREFLADASGALLTRYPEGLAGALGKISKYSGKMKRANHATAHLFISSPFGAKARKGFNKLWMTHPPVEKRIKALRGEKM